MLAQRHQTDITMAGDLKNVIVFALGGVRHAAELRWVREVVTLGFVTEIPTAPPGLTGAFNLRGNLIPVLDTGVLVGGNAGPSPRQGDGALLVELDGVAAALRVDKVDEVATLQQTADGRAVIDSRGRTVPLVDPSAVVRRAIADSLAMRGEGDGDVASELTADNLRPARDPTTGAKAPPGFDGDSTLG
jgi:chemotaxis signal transduction protein